MKRSRHAGFTLIEVMMVVVIIGIFASLSIPSFLEMAHRARRAEQSIVFHEVERAAKYRFTSSTVQTGALLTSWNPVAGPAAFDATAAGWRELEVGFDGALRYSYLLSGTYGVNPSFTVTSREALRGRLIYRTREWQFCDQWVLLNDTIDGVAQGPIAQPCAAGSAPAPGSSDDGNSGGNDTGDNSGGNNSGGNNSGGNNSGGNNSGGNNSGGNSNGNNSGGNGNGNSGGNGNGNSGGNGNGNSGGNGNGNSGGKGK